MRYAAPPDVTKIHLSCGTLLVADGFVEVPDDATQGDLGGLATYGFQAAPPLAVAAAPAPNVGEEPAHEASPEDPSA